MAAELFCQTHGPYDAAYGTCPYCSGEFKRPPAASPLNEDDLPTDLGYRGQPGASFVDDDDAPTDLGAGRARGKGFLDLEEEETDYGKAAREDITEFDELPTGLLGILWVSEGQRRGQIYRIKHGTVVSRKDGEMILDDPKVSNPHAKFTVEDEQFTVWDFGSRNGTSVNGERIRAATLLQENDKVKMGDTVFILKLLP